MRALGRQKPRKKSHHDDDSYAVGVYPIKSFKEGGEGYQSHEADGCLCLVLALKAFLELKKEANHPCSPSILLEESGEEGIIFWGGGKTTETPTYESRLCPAADRVNYSTCN